MNHTQNLHLPQWEADDRIMRTDFNNAFAAIDAALAATPHVAAGTYTGNGQASRVISLGFTPKAVFVTEKCGLPSITNSYQYGGLAVPGGPALHDGDAAKPVVKVVDGGFQCFYNQSTGVQSNVSSATYYYFALG